MGRPAALPPPGLCARERASRKDHLMREHLRHYIGGQWVESRGGTRHEVINPATEEPCTVITLGSTADVDAAVAAARAAFPGFAATSVAERLALLDRIAEGYKA